jgi:RNA polymerase sigma-70 factor (ECF subfamily)
MAKASNLTLQVQGWLDRLQAGDESARKELINCACERLTRLTRKMLKNYPRLKRWEQTDDVFQNAAVASTGRWGRSGRPVPPTSSTWRP